MMNNNEMTQLYDTLLCIPGMNETVKLNLQVNRKLILLLSQILEHGLATQKEPGNILSYFPAESGEELKSLVSDVLEKSGLGSLHEKLKSFRQK